MRQEVIYTREVCTPQNVADFWITKNIHCNALYALQSEKEALAKAGYDFNKGGYFVADRIIDRNDGKKKTVFLKYQIEAIAVEHP